MHTSAEVVQARQLPEGHYTDIVTRLSRVPRPSRAPTQRAWLAGCCAMPWNMLVQPVGLLKGPPPISQFSPFHSVRLLTYLCSSSLSFENRVKRSTPTCAFQKVLAEYPPFQWKGNIFKVTFTNVVLPRIWRICSESLTSGQVHANTWLDFSCTRVVPYSRCKMQCG